MRCPARLLAAVVAPAAASAAAAPTASAARPLRMGFYDDILTAAPAEAAPWQSRALAIGVARMSSGWGDLAPTRPAKLRARGARTARPTPPSLRHSPAATTAPIPTR